VLLFSFCVPKNTKTTFSWSYGLCNYKGIYDTEKYTANQLQNTLDISILGILLQTNAVVFNVDSISTLNLEKLTAEYQEKKKYFDTVEVIQTNDVQTLKKLLLKKLEEEYFFKKMAIEVYKEPKTILNYSEKCQEYSQVIASEEEEKIIQVCREMITERVKSGLYQQTTLDEFESNMQTPQKRNYATVQLITFGWWNCVNNTINDPTENEITYNEFKGLFEKLEEQCDEP